MIDKEKIIGLLTELDEYLNSLNDLQNLTIEEYLVDKRNILVEDIYFKYQLKLVSIYLII